MVIITGCENAAVRPGKEGRGASSSLSSTSAQAYHAAALGECQHGEAQSAHSLSAAALPLALADQSILDARSRHIVTKAIAGNTLATSEVAHLLDKAAKWKASGSLHLQALISCSPPSSPIGGSLFLINRAQAPQYMSDGHSWRRKERHMTLKVGGRDKVNCYYATPSASDESQGGTLQRRRYWLLHRRDLVLLHYWEQPRGRARGAVGGEAMAASVPSETSSPAAADASAAAADQCLEGQPPWKRPRLLQDSCLDLTLAARPPSPPSTPTSAACHTPSPALTPVLLEGKGDSAASAKERGTCSADIPYRTGDSRGAAMDLHHCQLDSPQGSPLEEEASGREDVLDLDAFSFGALDNPWDLESLNWGPPAASPDLFDDPSGAGSLDMRQLPAFD